MNIGSYLSVDILGTVLFTWIDSFSLPLLQSRANGPRQPWHDLHCKVEGPAAYDILTNFEQRWRKASRWPDFRLKKVGRWHDDALIKVDRISWILSPGSGPKGDQVVQVTDEQDPESWHVQVSSHTIHLENQ